MSKFWRKIAVTLTVASMLLAFPTVTLAHGGNNKPFVTSATSDGAKTIKVCYPFGESDWDLSRLKDAAVNYAMQEYNDLNQELYFKRAQATCNYLKNTKQPFVAVRWDDDPDCFFPFPFGIGCGVDVMTTYRAEADAGSQEAKDWSSNLQGQCNGENRCSIWAEIRVDHSQPNFYWGNDSQYNFNNNLLAGKGMLTHEFGHATGALSHLYRHDPPPYDAYCQDMTYPSSTNSIMCEVIEAKEWNVTVKFHDSEELKEHYYDN